MTGIAGLFGVSRRRVSALLAPAPAPDAVRDVARRPRRTSAAGG